MHHPRSSIHCDHTCPFRETVVDRMSAMVAHEMCVGEETFGYSRQEGTCEKYKYPDIGPTTQSWAFQKFSGRHAFVSLIIASV